MTVKPVSFSSSTDLGGPDLERIEQAGAAVLDAYLERVLTADSIAAVLGPE